MIPDRPNMNFANLLWRVCLYKRRRTAWFGPPPLFSKRRW